MKVRRLTSRPLRRGVSGRRKSEAQGFGRFSRRGKHFYSTGTARGERHHTFGHEGNGGKYRQTRGGEMAPRTLLAFILRVHTFQRLSFSPSSSLVFDFIFEAGELPMNLRRRLFLPVLYLRKTLGQVIKVTGRLRNELRSTFALLGS